MKSRMLISVNLVFLTGILAFSFPVKPAFALKDALKEIEDRQAKEPAPTVNQGLGRPRVEYKGGDFKDPFESNITEEVGPPDSQLATGTPDSEKVPELKAQGIIWGGSTNQAIINNKVLKVGDNIEEAKVVRIDKDGVTVFYRGKTYKISPPAVEAGMYKKDKGGENENKF